MPALAVSLPLEPLLLTSYWTWLLALCVATIATFSRLSLLSLIMDRKPINCIVSSGHARLHHQLALKEHTPSEAEHTKTEQHEVPCMWQEGAEMANPWIFLHQRWEACAEEEEEEEEEDEEEERGSPWVCSLLEVSRTPLQVCRASPSRLVKATNFTSWSEDVHRLVSARVGMPWHITEKRVGRVGMGGVYQENAKMGPSLVDYCSNLQVLTVQVPSISPTISAFHAATCHGFAHEGFLGCEIALWDVEKSWCLNCIHGMKSGISALVVLPSHPRVAIAAVPHHLKRTSAVVSVWDERCPVRSASFTLAIPAAVASLTTVFECRAGGFCAPEGGYLSMHDLRMLKEKPMSLYTAHSVGHVGGGGQGKRKDGRRPDMREYDFNSPSVVVGEAEDSTVMGKVNLPSTSHLDGSQYSRKRRCSFLNDCLSFMCCLVQYPPLL